MPERLESCHRGSAGKDLPFRNARDAAGGEGVMNGAVIGRMQLILSAEPSSCPRPAVCLNQPLLWAVGVEKLEIIHLKIESTDTPMQVGPCAQNSEGFWGCFMMSNEGQSRRKREHFVLLFKAKI